MEAFLLWLFIDCQVRGESGDGDLFLITSAFLKYSGVRQNSPKIFLHHNLLGMCRSGAANSFQKSSDSLFLWKVYPWLGTSQIE